MIQSFKNKATEDVFNGEDTKKARRVCPINLWTIATRKLDLLDSVVNFDELKIPPNNKLKELNRDRKGQHSIRINDQYRICFIWHDRGVRSVEITDYH